MLLRRREATTLLPQARLKRVLSKALLVLTSVTVTLLLLEGVARLARRFGGGGKEAGETDRYHEYDPLLGWRKTPNAQVVYKRREYQVEVRINGLGLRDPERTRQPAPGTYRILALGDSFLEGYTVPLEQAATQVLEKSLRRRGCAVEVLNGGTAAYSTDQEVLFYQWQGVDYGSRVVALFFYYNDVLFNDRQEYFGSFKPAFELHSDGLCLHRYPVRERQPAPPAQEAEAAEKKAGSALLEWIQDRMWYGAPGAYNGLARLGLWKPMPAVSPRLEMFVYSRRQLDEIEGAWQKTEALLDLLNREVRAQGAQLLVVYVPSKMEVQERSWELTKTLYRLNERQWDRGAVARRLTLIGGSRGFPVLDLTTALRRADRGVLGTPHFTYDGHWTPVGHAVAARETEAFLARVGWLPPCTGSAPRP